VKSEKVTSQALAGNLLGDPAERTVYVLLPPGYAASDRRYPVVYVMPWANGDPGTNAWGFKVAMESLLGKGENEEMIVVVPDGTDKLGGSFFKSSPTIGDYETYLTRDVVGYVDTHYRTLPTRDSRGLAGCSNGGSISMRLALKYPNVFSVVAASGGSYNDSLEVWPSDLENVKHVTELPQDFNHLQQWAFAWYIQMAAAAAPDPNNPPFYCEMPVRIVNGHGEFIPEVVAKIVDQDAMHKARRYAQQPVRLRGILIRHGSLDEADLGKSAHSFDQLLTGLGIEHEYVEEKAGHCAPGWEAAELKYMADKLAFEK
jgi:pimeloyl-ACP methyl ester carboxylesterase